jgi:cell division protein FtsL
MTRLNLVLMLALLVSALYLVHLQYESRRVFVEMERARSAGDRLAAEHEQLLVQKRAHAAPARVQQLATGPLQMRPAHPGITEYFSLPRQDAPDGASVGQVQRLQGPLTTQEPKP